MAVEGHEEGQKAPFPPVWAGDPYSGHHSSCGVRVKHRCTCGQDEFVALEAARLSSREEAERRAGRRAEMPLALEYLHDLLNIPADVHVISIYATDLNVVLELEAFADNTFPGTRVTARFHEEWDIKTGGKKIVFDGWESID